MLPAAFRKPSKNPHFSQEKLAQKAGIPFSTLTKIESGNTPNPSIDTVVKIADALEVGLDELMGRKG